VKGRDNIEPQLKYEDTECGGQFRLTIDGLNVGYVTFVKLSENMIDLNHTVVKKEYEGHGYGKILVNAVLDMAKEKGLIVIPSCSYAEHLMKKMEPE
jgi:uncharacterized protein